MAEWRRVALKMAHGKKLDILVALANVNRAENDKLPLYELAGGLIDAAWQQAKARGLVSDAMVALDDAVAQGGKPVVYARAEEVA